MRTFLPAALAALVLPTQIAWATDAGSASRHIKRHLAAFDITQVGPTLFGTPTTNITKKIEYGTKVQLASSNGNTLAVGAPHHGYSSSTADPNTVNDEGGAIFLYTNNGTSWNEVASFFGKPGEEMGDYFALSADGSSIAIRRYNRTARSSLQVEVYDVAANGTTTKRGSSLSCGANGNSVALAASGNRIAVGGHTYNATRGLVEVFDWNPSSRNWGSIGKIIGSTFDNNTWFGWDISFDDSGNRIAVSAPYYDFGGLPNRGLVRVFDYVGSRWTQVGADILGLTAEEQFGYSMDMSGNGLYIVAGAPQSNVGGNATQYGAVSVYGLVGLAWSQVGQFLHGEKSSDRFGRSVSISGDGGRIAASSFIANALQGVVKLLDFVGGQWLNIGEINGKENQDRLGLSVTLTRDGIHVASGSIWANNSASISTGLVQVYNINTVTSTAPSPPPIAAPSATDGGLAPQDSAPPSIEQSPAPSVPPTVNATPLPTRSPTSLATKSPSRQIPISSPTPGPSSSPVKEPSQPPAPSVSPVRPSPVAPVPTTLITSIPTVTLSKFDWDLERTGDAVVSFGDSTETGEIILNYNISNRLALISILDGTCTNIVSPSIVGVTLNTVIVTSTHSNLEVGLDVKQETVVESDVWSDGDNGVGFVSLCVRVDLVLDDDNTTSINFHEQKIFITIDLKQGFSVVNVDLNREGADETEENADLDYTILACQCNAAFVCVNEVLVQGADVYICVYSNSSDVKVAGISGLSFKQDGFTASPIVNFTEDAITSVDVFPQGALIRSQLRSIFFVDPNPQDIVADGVALLSFGNGVRLLRSIPLSRELQETEGDSKDFSVALGLTNSSINTPVDASNAPHAATTIVIIAMAVGGSLLGFFV